MAGEQATLSDVFAVSAADTGALGFVLAHMPRNGQPILWVQDRLSFSQSGHPCVAGLNGLSILRVQAAKPRDVLWAMEEGLRNGAVTAVIGEIWGDPPVLDFTATRRLALQSHTHLVPAWLIRRASTPNLSAARNRWRVTSLPSLPHPDDPRAPGDPRWRVELFRSRTLGTGTWIARYDRAAHYLHLSAPLRDGAMADTQQEGGQRACG